MDRYQQYDSLMQVISGRFSCRAFDSDKSVSRDLIERVLEAARLAPSACNRQPWKFAVLTSESSRAAVAATYSREFLAQAPVIIVALGLHNEAWHRGCDSKDHTDVDVSIAVEHIALAAASLGLGTCWICNFDAPALARALNLDDGVEPIAIIPLGFPAMDGAEKKRKTLGEIASWPDC